MLKVTVVLTILHNLLNLKEYCNEAQIFKPKFSSNCKFIVNLKSPVYCDTFQTLWMDEYFLYCTEPLILVWQCVHVCYNVTVLQTKSFIKITSKSGTLLVPFSNKGLQLSILIQQFCLSWLAIMKRRLNGAVLLMRPQKMRSRVTAGEAR